MTRLQQQPEWAGTLRDRGGAALLDTYARYQLEFVSGCGCELVDSSGSTYLDFTAGVAVNVLGHAHPAIVAAIRAASEDLIHVSNLYWSEPMVRLAERLTKLAGMERAFFCNSGAEAVEASLKLARKARPGRPRTLCFAGSFHGRTLGALSLTAQPRYQEPFAPLLANVDVLPFGDLGAVADALDGTVAAVIVEPIQGEGGMNPAPAGWLAHLRALCDAHGALLIFDEVQSGIGRTGAFYAYQNDHVLPDMAATAKALAAGLPMGALLARGDAAGAFAPGDHGSTFGGGPLVASVAHAVLDQVLAPGFMAAVRERGERLLTGLGSLVDRHPLAVAARGRGLMQGLVLCEPRAGEVVAAAQDRRLLLCPAGPDVVRFVPPLVVSDEEIDAALAIVEEALDACGKEHKST